MGYRKYFTQNIHLAYPGTANEIVAETDQNFLALSKDTDFAITSPNPMDRRLEFSTYFLALIKTLHTRGESFEVIRSLCLRITIAYVQPKNAFHRYIKKLIPKLISTRPGRRLIQVFKRKVERKGHPDGFRVNVITDESETFGLGFGIDVMECGICKLFHKHDYSMFASILCEVDQITSELAGLKLIRTGTIANGAHKCDFRFSRKGVFAVGP
jgi:hypothetical protein